MIEAVVRTQAATRAGSGGRGARPSPAPGAADPAATPGGEEVAGEAERQQTGPLLLIVEDETQLLRLLVRVFGAAGFRVLSAADGETALELFEHHRDEVAAVFVDVGIPPAGARGFLDGLTAPRQDLGVVLMSGDNLDVELQERLDACGGRFIRKPFAGEAAVRTVNAVLVGTDG